MASCESKSCTQAAECKVTLHRLTNLSGNYVDDKISTRQECLCNIHAKEADGKCLERDGKGMIQYAIKTEPLV